MDTLRFLLVHADASQSERISSVLEDAHHTVLPTPSLDEAGEALALERFDAVLLGSPFAFGTVAEFKAKLSQLAQTQQAFARIPILSALTGAAAESPAAIEDPSDGYFEDPLDLNALTEAVHRLSHSLQSLAGQPRSGLENTEFPVLAPDELEEQVGGDRELMVEIIDLFLEERKLQVKQMRASLKSCDWDSLAKLAHTIKGSLGSLHAPRARVRAQELETAAQACQRELCGQSFAALEQDLEDLEPALLALRALSV